MTEATSLTREEFWSLFTGITLVNSTSRLPHQHELDGYKISLIATYCTLFLIGICGNAWVALVMGRLLLDRARHGNRYNFNSSSQTPLQIYIFALCCSDLIVLCFLILLIFDLLYGRWIAPESTLLCQLYLCSESLNKFCGPFFLVALSGYCYIRVCRSGASSSVKSVQTRPVSGGEYAQDELATTTTTPSRRRLYFSQTLLRTKSCLFVIAACLCAVFVLVTPVYLYADVYYLILHNSTVIFSIAPKCALQPSENILTAFTAYSFVCAYLLPAGLFTFFYSSIMRKAWVQARSRQRHERRLLSISIPVNSADCTSPSQNRRTPKSYLSRVVKTTSGLVLFYLCCWTPYWAMSLYRYTIPDHKQGQTTDASIVLSYFLHALPYVNCTGYPILYTVLNKNIKSSYKRMKLKKEVEHSRSAAAAVGDGRRSDGKLMMMNVINRNAH